jgi:hypothetical protein
MAKNCNCPTIFPPAFEHFWRSCTWKNHLKNLVYQMTCGPLEKRIDDAVAKALAAQSSPAPPEPADAEAIGLDPIDPNAQA